MLNSLSAVTLVTCFYFAAFAMGQSLVVIVSDTRASKKDAVEQSAQLLARQIYYHYAKLNLALLIFSGVLCAIFGEMGGGPHRSLAAGVSVCLLGGVAIALAVWIIVKRRSRKLAQQIAVTSQVAAAAISAIAQAKDGARQNAELN